MKHLTKILPTDPPTGAIAVRERDPPARPRTRVAQVTEVHTDGRDDNRRGRHARSRFQTWARRSAPGATCGVAEFIAEFDIVGGVTL